MKATKLGQVEILMLFINYFHLYTCKKSILSLNTIRDNEDEHIYLTDV
jgi:hypothetical protein